MQIDDEVRELVAREWSAARSDGLPHDAATGRVVRRLQEARPELSSSAALATVRMLLRWRGS
jgi:hypothetical protein